MNITEQDLKEKRLIRIARGKKRYIVTIYNSNNGDILYEIETISNSPANAICNALVNHKVDMTTDYAIRVNTEDELK